MEETIKNAIAALENVATITDYSHVKRVLTIIYELGYKEGSLQTLLENGCK